MSEKLHFKVSAGLKNIIGKELINDKFIAIFELVKNSYDAGAKEVTIKFENIYSDDSTIYIIDDGKGMSKQEIIDKWLFVAYSEKKNNTYRDNIKFRRNYAGAKGVGRFSCDRLGETVELLSKTNKDINVNRVNINWNEFENVDTEEFQNIEVLYDEIQSDLIAAQGTVIKIYGLREKWNRDELLQLKKSLTQLVNPEANENYDMFSIILDVKEERENDRKKSENEKVFDKDRSDIDIMILSKYQLELYDEIEIEDYLQKILSEYFSYDNLHFTFISEFNYPFSEILLISDDKIIFQEEEYLDYVLGYSAFKRDREALEVMREENLKDLESFRNGLL